MSKIAKYQISLEFCKMNETYIYETFENYAGYFRRRKVILNSKNYFI